MAVDQLSRLGPVEGETYKQGIEPITGRLVFAKRSDSNMDDERLIRMIKHPEVLISLFEDARNCFPTYMFLRDKGFIDLVNGQEAN